MKNRRCALVAAAVAAVCAVAFLCRNRPSAEAEGKVLSSGAASLAKTSVVASSGVAPAPVLQPSSNQTATVRGTKPYVLVSEARFNKPLRLAAEALGARTIGVKSVHALLIEADPATRARLIADGRFVSVDEFHPAAKIAPELAAAIKGGAESVEAGIMTLTPEDHRIVQERVVAMGGEVLTGCLNDGGIFRARISAGCVAELASRGDVRWLELFERPHLSNNLAPDPEMMNVRSSWKSEENPGGLSGTNQIITTSDSGIDSGDTKTMHPDLRDRVVGIRVVEGCSKTDVLGHGTHTAGSIVGTGAMWTNETEKVVRGMAWGAQLWAWFCGVGGSGIRTPQSMSELFRPDQENYPAYIHSASWGSSTYGRYTSECISLDRYVWANPDFLPVFSAGNDGRSGSGTIGSPAAAKNVLAVGATQSSRIGHDGGWGNGDPQQTAVFSSRGPCMDGRIKPDIATPGVGTLSTRSHGVAYEIYGEYDEFYAYDSGTSMACPLMAGATALVREWLLRPEQGFTDEEPPSSALMKAIITGGAKDAAVPNNKQGWGRFDLRETLFPADRAVYLVDKIPYESGEEFAWIVETTNGAPFDVQLVWVDHPGEPGDDGSPKLINDLDLTVERMDGDDATVLYGNGGAGPDDRNNLESVRIASAEPNRYLVTVNCKDILFDYEDGGAAALYIRGAFDPESVKEVTTIHIRETDHYYRSLDAALAAVKSDETIEILGEARLKSSFLVTNSFTITATNANPWASLVDFRNGAQLMITNGAAVTFENIAFVSNGRTQVRVFDGSRARLSGAFGIDRIQTDNWSCLELATVITNVVEVDCLAAPGVAAGGNLVAWSALDPVTMSASANHLLNPFNEEYGGVATVGSAFGKDVPTLVFWQDGALVPDGAAAVKLVEPGKDPVNYRTLSALIRHLAKTGDTTAYVIRDTVMTNAVDVSGWRLTLAAPDANRAVGLSVRAGFRVGANGSLTFANVTFLGTADGSLVEVKDGGAFTLDGGACIRELVGDTAAIAIASGTMTMRPESAIIGCQANGPSAMGGAIAMGGEGCVLNLEGGGITECSAAMFGGGVYAGWGAEINLSGPLTVYRNSSGSSEVNGVYDDICAPYGCTLTLKGNLTGGRVRVGMSYHIQYAEENKPFIANDLGSAVTDSTLASFVCEDPNADKAMEAALSEDEQSLIWVEADYLPDTERKEGHVAQIVLEGGAVTNYFRYLDGPDGAFAAIEALEEDGLAVELLRTDTTINLYETIPVKRKVALRLADEVTDRADAVVYRMGSCGFEVLPGGKLTVDGVEIRGYYNGFGKNSTVPLLHAKGGALVLTNETLVTDVACKANRGVGAVDVSDNGTFTMTEGAEISNCVNNYVNESDQTGVGAGLLVDKGTAYLRGGRITGNRAYRAAGVFIGNEGVLHVSGNTVVTGNKTLLLIDGRGGDKSDIVLEDYGRLYLDGELSGGPNSMGIAEGLVSEDTDKNIFGRVADALLPEIWNYTDSAAMFFRDAQETVTGRIATNATEALLVWSSAMPNGVYTNANGEVYGRVDDPPSPPPPPEPPWEVVTTNPTPIAFKSIDRMSDTEWRLVITDRVEYCNYRLIWTDDLTKGFTSTGDWEHAVGEAAAPTWTTNVITTGGTWFWRAEGTEGTNMVPPQVEN